MDPQSAIVGALAAGALAVSKDIGGQAVKDGYNALKRVLVDGYGFVTTKLIEDNPDSNASKTAVEAELSGKPGAVGDPEVQAKAGELLDALSGLPVATQAEAGIDIKSIVAGRDLIASGKWLTGDSWTGGRDVKLYASGSDKGK